MPGFFILSAEWPRDEVCAFAARTILPSSLVAAAIVFENGSVLASIEVHRIEPAIVFVRVDDQFV